MYVQAFFIFFISLSSCKNSTHYSKESLPDSVLTDVMSWLKYERKYIHWESNYVCFDGQNQISKKDFLQRLATGKYIPVQIGTYNNSILSYSLYSSPKMLSNEVSRVISERALRQYNYLLYEGKNFPLNRLQDINGKKLSSTMFENKVVVINCWFTTCLPCIAEIEKLNNLTRKYREEPVSFIALSTDSAYKVRGFLKTHPFYYTQVSNMKKFLTDSFPIYGYPTHILVDKSGKIFRVIELDSKVLDVLIEYLMKK